MCVDNPYESPLDRRLAVRRGLSVTPVSGRDAQSAHPVNIQAALRAVEDEVLELALQVDLHVQHPRTEDLPIR
jgi:hypothetical protein